MTRDLSKLSKAEKLHLIDVMEEKKRRLRERKAAYVQNAGQRLVHASRKKIRAVFAGNGSGKTALGVNEVLWAVQGYNPTLETFTKVPARVVVVLDLPDKVADVWLPELRKWTNIPDEWCHARGRPYTVQIGFPNGSEIIFMFHAQTELVFESIEVDFVCYDEPPPRHCWVGLLRGGRKKGRKPRYLFIGTPLAAPWMRTELYEPWVKGEKPDVECFRYDTDVNEANLSEGYKEAFGAHLTEKEKRVRFTGEFFDLEGLALAHIWKRATHVLTLEQFEAEWEGGPCVVSIDPHPEKKHVSTLMGCDRRGNLISIKEYASREVPAEYARSLVEWYAGFNVIDIVCDSLGATALTGGDGNKSFMQVLRENGVPVRSTSFKDKDEDSWIMRIQSNLVVPQAPGSVPKWRVVETCRGIIGDVESVQWTKVKGIDLYKPRLDMQHKDFLSTVKYAFASHLTPEKEKAVVFNHRPVETYGQKAAPTLQTMFGIRPKRMTYGSKRSTSRF